MARLRRGVVVWVMVVVEAVAASTPLQLRWTTDFNACQGGDNCGALGPDGPWQALVVDVGDVGSAAGEGSNATEVAMYPIFTYGSSVLTKSAGGKFDPSKSKTANTTGFDTLTEAWSGDSFLEEEVNGTNYNGFLGLSVLDTIIPVNTTYKAVDSLEVKLPNGSNYTNKIGNLGLGPVPEPSFPGDSVGAPDPLTQLKADKQIASRSWSLHMGSAALKLPGSLILGGYDQSRVINPVGKFLGGSNNAWLVDLMLGMEDGGTAFGEGANIRTHVPRSVWQGVGGSAEAINLTKSLGGQEGSAAVAFSPFAPYIYLPPGNCERIAEYLLVSWRDDIKYYVWKVNDPAYEKIINSSAYLAFVLADAEAKNITIKLPFALLNLTLDAPIVSEPTQYFPCQSANTTYGFWELGRAFLQGAFVIFNYDTNVSYFAQAPGPFLPSSSIQTIDGDNTKITGGQKTFESSWNRYWTIYPEDGDIGDSTEQHSSVSIGLIAGIVVGVGALVAIAVAATVFLCRRRRKRRREEKENDSQRNGNGIGDKSNGLSETDGVQVLEVPAEEMRHELLAPNVYHEAAAVEAAHELPADESWHRKEEK